MKRRTSVVRQRDNFPYRQFRPYKTIENQVVENMVSSKANLFEIKKASNPMT